MRAMLFAGLTAGLVAFAGPNPAAVGQVPKDAPRTEARTAGTDTPAADFTRVKLLKAKMNGDFTNVSLGDILKEFAHLAEMETDQPVMWNYGAGFPFSQKVTFAIKDKPLEVALDELLKKAGGGLGYLVVSKDGDKYDGWVRLTTTGERGSLPPAATEAEETEAASKLTLAKKLIDAGKGVTAKPVLEIIVRKFPTTKAAAEAKELIGKIEKDK